MEVVPSLTVLLPSRRPEGCRALVGAGAAKVLVERISNEPIELQATALEALRLLMAQPAGLEDCIREDALPSLLLRLESPAAEVRKQAALALAAFTAHTPEKIQAGAAALPPLLSMLGSGDRSVTARCAASAALMSLTTETGCKRAAAEAGGAMVLSTALSECIEAEGLGEADWGALAVNLLQALAHVAEHPGARRQLKERKATARELALLEGSSDARVRKHAARTGAQINWAPGANVA